MLSSAYFRCRFRLRAHFYATRRQSLINLTNILVTILRQSPTPWLKSTTLVKPSHRRLAHRRLSELPCLS